MRHPKKTRGSIYDTLVIHHPLHSADAITRHGDAGQVIPSRAHGITSSRQWSLGTSGTWSWRLWLASLTPRRSGGRSQWAARYYCTNLLLLLPYLVHVVQHWLPCIRKASSLSLCCIDCPPRRIHRHARFRPSFYSPVFDEISLCSPVPSPSLALLFSLFYLFPLLYFLPPLPSIPSFGFPIFWHHPCRRAH
jgi:hypothetical protein